LPTSLSFLFSFYFSSSPPHRDIPSFPTRRSSDLQHANGTFYVPMATSEGALIRSYERGMVALTHSGGVQTAVIGDENHISPSFFFPSVSLAHAFTLWVQEHLSELQTEAATTTRHGKLLGVQCFPIGRQVILQLRFSTGDAQG